MNVTDEQYEGALTKLRQERAFALAAGDVDAVAAIDAELARLEQSQKPEQRKQRRRFVVFGRLI